MKRPPRFGLVIFAVVGVAQLVLLWRTVPAVVIGLAGAYAMIAVARLYLDYREAQFNAEWHRKALSELGWNLRGANLRGAPLRRT